MGHRVPLVQKANGMYVLIDSEGVERLSTNNKYYCMDSNTLFYGISAKCDLLPIITGKENLRFNLQTTAKLGLVSAQWNELKGVDWVETWNGPFPEYGLGLCESYFFTKRLGLSLGYSVGKYYNNDNSRLSYGITLKF